MKNYKNQLDRLSDHNKPVMLAIIALFDSEAQHELVPKQTKGDWLNKDNYLRHNVIGKKQGKGIYIQSFDGSVLEIESRKRKFYFGERVNTDTVMDLLSHLKEEISK